MAQTVPTLLDQSISLHHHLLLKKLRATLQNYNLLIQLIVRGLHHHHHDEGHMTSDEIQLNT